MIGRTALFVAAIAAHTTVLNAQDQTAKGQASFIFNGSQISISQNSAQAADYAARFSAVPPSCDPHCIAPFQAAVGIETVIEPQVLNFLVNAVGKNEGLLLDARMPEDRALGYIPGSVSLPFATLAQDNKFRDQILMALGVRVFEDVYNFSDAQRLMIYDNGPSQNDAGVLISYLLEAGYPPELMSYYRGGMQVWSVLALTIEE
ncbi:rhodanese-like domain-containing protein [uncultured Sulfitobacter sp.]|uniref:rhodanese-like domain-containing protein n=1 Tax=uncultured Sulfitobacter sp. TaxID=191468 RepID=UPI0026033FBB|nr:rhodanese-like domain-containing protein [uncultured Sulfitobacter sp.]